MRFNQLTLMVTIIFCCFVPYIQTHPQYYDLLNNDILSDTEFNVDSDVCLTTDCQNTAKVLKTNLNTSVDPCDDFYEFSCGGFIATHTIPPGRGGAYYDDELEKFISDKINKSINNNIGKSGPTPMVFASELYKSCMDFTTRESLGFTPLTSAVNKIGGWPLVNGSFNETAFDWKESFAKMISVFGTSPIFSFNIYPDSNDTKVNRFQFKAGGIGMGLLMVPSLNDTKALEAYKQRVLRLALLMGAKNNSQTLKQIEDMVAFEVKVITEILPEKVEKPPLELYNRMTFKALSNLTDNRVDWIKLMNNIYEKLNSSVRVSSEELVIVPDIPYYKAVSKLLETTPKRTLANYFAYALVFSYDYEMITHENRAANEKRKWMSCRGAVSGLTNVVSRLFVESVFSKKDKEVASVIVNDIKDSFVDLLKQNNWLDSTTKAKALLKLNAVHQNVGYPDWILNDTLLENYYNLTRKADPKNFFENILYLNQRKTLSMFNSLREVPDLDASWYFPSQELNAAYSHTQNSITIPAAILFPPFFNSKLPAQINYGAIGGAVGHELTHAFDNEGSQFDANGNLRNWWTKQMSQKFTEKSECFIKQYTSILDTQTQLKLNGTRTLGEDMADNGGIREAYGAYLKYVEKHGKQQRLPLISDYSAEQQFFISYANTWCSKYDTKYLMNLIQSPQDNHSPAKYRVNIPLSNFKTFSDVFKCSTNSRMNIKNKCNLW